MGSVIVLLFGLTAAAVLLVTCSEFPVYLLCVFQAVEERMLARPAIRKRCS